MRCQRFWGFPGSSTVKSNCAFYFISYSPVDGEEIALKLGDQLTMGPPSIPVWRAARDLQAGIDRYEQIVQALAGCIGLLYVMTTDGTHPYCGCRQEWTRALKYKKPIIPLLFDRDVEVPFQLEPREPIDFRLSFDAGLARLRDHLRWRGTADGVLHTLGERLKDARRDFASAASAERPRIQEEIAELERQIGEQRQAIENPHAAQQRTEKSIQAGLVNPGFTKHQLAFCDFPFTDFPDLFARPGLGLIIH